MRLTKKLLEKFNSPETKLVVSRWPSSAHGTRFDGIAAYTFETVTTFTKQQGVRFVVLAEKVPHAPEIELVEGKILVWRIFDDKRRSLFPQILRGLMKFPSIRDVVVHSEFCASGGPEFRLLKVPFLGLIRLTGRRITYYAHNVIFDLSKIADHFDLSKTSLKYKVYEQGLEWYTRGLNLMVDRFVVLEEVIAKRLAEYVPQKKILIEPIWAEKREKKLSNVEAKKKLGFVSDDVVVMSFGFVTYYKGADWLARFAEQVEDEPSMKKFKFVLAGGEAYSLKKEKYYQEYYGKIQAKADKLANLRLTGFLDEKDLALWFSAADIVVFPYRDLIGGSAAMATAIGFGKLCLVSRPMMEELKHGRVGRVLNQLNLKDSRISFELKKQSLKNLLLDVVSGRESSAWEKYRVSVMRAWNKKNLMKRHFDEVYKNIGDSSLQPIDGVVKWLKKKTNPGLNRVYLGYDK